jgi:deoxyhypusine synthase
MHRRRYRRGDNGWNRIGNMVIQNENYFELEYWFTEALDELLSGDNEDYPNGPLKKGNPNYHSQNPLILTPSKLIHYLGKKLNNENSVIYWCYKNNIPVYSPALTDGSLGDILTFYSRRKALVLDIVEDIYSLNISSLGGQKNGAIVLGGGLVKHQILNANLFNDGLDYCVIINTAHEYDASDSGAALSEAHSWGKVKHDSTGVKVHGEASIVFPLVCYGAFKSKK